MGDINKYDDQRGPWEENQEPETMPIAIVGMSCRLPGGADSPDKLWDMVVNGRSAWSEIPESRFNRDAWYHPDKEHIGTVSTFSRVPQSMHKTFALLTKRHRHSSKGGISCLKTYHTSMHRSSTSPLRWLV